MAYFQQKVSIDQVEAIRYRVRSDGRHGPRRNSLNGLVLLKGSAAGESGILGMGEAPFRGRDTGDGQGGAWEFLTGVVQLLRGQEISTVDAKTARESVFAILNPIVRLANERESEEDRTQPRGSANQLKWQTAMLLGIVPKVPALSGVLFGLETALLDLAARAMNISVAELLGGASSEVQEFEPLTLRHFNLKYGKLHDHLHSYLKRVPEGSEIGIDFERGLTRKQALQHVRRLLKVVSTRQITAPILILRPLRVRQMHHATSFVNEAKAIAREFGVSDRFDVAVEILPGKQRWVRTLGRGRSNQDVGICPASVGGIQSAQRLIQRVNRSQTRRVFILNVEGGGSVSLAALNQLAAAAPGAVGVAGKASAHNISHATGPGLGIAPPWEDLVDTLTGYVAFPPEVGTVSGPEVNVFREVPFLQPLGPNGTKGHLLEREALALGLNTKRYSKGAFTLTDEIHAPLVFKWSRSPLSSASALALCTHKEATRLRLASQGIPVPRGRTFRNGDFETAREFAELIGYPVVVKPAMGVRGIGVVAGIRDEKELAQAFEQLTNSKLGDQDFIVEKHISGRDYRIVVVGDKVIAAILREPASVIGNGEHSVAELMIRKNAMRRLNPHLWGRPIIYDLAAKYQLERLGMTLDSVPADGQRVMLSNSCSLSQGGDSTDVLDELHPSIIEACVRSVKAIPGLGFCGVDFLLEDHSKPLEEQDAGICELNAHAAIGNCEYPFFGKPRQVARTFINEVVERYDLEVAPERADSVSLRLVVKGRVTGVGYRAWMRRRAQSSEVNGWVRNIGRRRVEVVLSGEVDATTALVAAAVLGPRRARPKSVDTRHIKPIRTSGFTIVEERPEEIVDVR